MARKCPHCHADAPRASKTKRFERYSHYPWYLQLVMFLVGFLGLDLIRTFVVKIAQSIYINRNPGASREDMIAFFGNGSVLMLLVGIVYGILFLCLGALVAIKIKENGKSFRSPRVFLGFAFLGAAMAWQITWGVISQMIGKAIGITPSANANQSDIVLMTEAVPWAAVLIFVFVGPICEEITYRVGLFGFTSRLGKAIGYVLTAIVFGLIHFNFDSFATGGADLANELLALPSYIGGGALLCLAYDFGGFGASLIAHTGVNLVSIISILSASNNGGA